jgi:primase-polymerase (primpol)-like protein
MSDNVLADQTIIPEALCDREQWVCWKKTKRDGKATKIPVTPGGGGFASSTDPETWTGFEIALEYAQTGKADGIGFVFTDDDPIVGVDLDDCRDTQTGEVDSEAQDIIERLDSYTEISPSGTGYHVLIEGELPEGRNRRGHIELYDRARFFTVTGDHLEEMPTHIARRQDALVAIHREYVQGPSSNEKSNSPNRGGSEDHSESVDSTDLKIDNADVDLDDEDLLEKAQRASNGPKFERLWGGNTGGYESNSEADMALCCLLAFWSGGNQRQIDRLFRQSGLLREKWDEVHFADGSTYGEKTIDRAISNTSEFYDPDRGNRSKQSQIKSHPLIGADTEAGVGLEESTRSQAYLTEKNRLLADRVDELEATHEQKNERIDTLEAEIQRLKDELTNRDQETQPALQEDVEESSTDSMWKRTKQRFSRR